MPVMNGQEQQRMTDFSTFFADEHDALLHFCWGLTLDRDVARDVAQEAMTRACSSWDRLVDGNPAGWLRTVALNLVRTRWRSEQRGAAALRRVGPPDDVVDRRDGPSVDEVRRALMELPERQREAVVLHHMVDLSVADVAAQMDVGIPAVKTHLQRGRATLARLLGDEYGGQDHA